MKLRTYYSAWWIFVAAAALCFGSARADAQEKKGIVYRLDNVHVNRGFSLRSADKPLLLTPATPSGGEIIKGRPGPLEISLSTYWYTHKSVLTVDAPETVTEGQEVTLGAIFASTFDLKEDAPNSEAYTSVRIGLPEGDVQTKKGPLKTGSFALKASKSVKVRFGDKSDKVLSYSTAKGVQYAKFGIDARTALSNQALFSVYFHYRAESGPVPPVTSGKLDVAVTGNRVVGEVLTVTATVRNANAGESVRLQLPAGLELVGSQEVQTLKAGQNVVTWRIRAVRAGPFEIRVHYGSHSQPVTLTIGDTQQVVGKLPDLPEHVRREIEQLQQVGRQQNWSFQIGQTGVSHIDLRQLCGFRIPDGIDLPVFVRHVNDRGNQWLIADRRVRDDFNVRQPNVLPEFKIEARVQEQVYARKTRFDWRDYDKVTPVRDQGSCGSCWGFAAVGALECNFLIRNNNTIRGSEQQMLDCVKNASCKGGWHMDVFDYLVQHGGCSGTTYPYTGTKADSCKTVTSPYRATSWGFVAADGRKPTVEAMKQALCKHGPLAVTVRTTKAFHHYVAGTAFNEHAPPRADDILHVVLLVGWDDSKGKNGSWAIRNSWDTKWGEQGYMWIEYGCNDVGDHAAWVEAASTHYSVMTLLMNDYRVKQGQDVYAPIHLLNPTNVKNMDWVLNFDSSVANLIEPSVLDGNMSLLAFRANPFQANRILLGFAQNSPLNASGQLARVHFKAVGAPGTRTPLTLEVKTVNDPQERPLPIKLVHGSIQIVKDDDVEQPRGSCCGQPRLVIEDALCALEMSVELRPRDMIMDMNRDSKVNSVDAAKIIEVVMGATRTGQ